MGLFKYDFKKIEKGNQILKAFDNYIVSNSGDTISKDWLEYKEDCAYLLYQKLYYADDYGFSGKWLLKFNNNQRKELAEMVANFAFIHKLEKENDKDAGIIVDMQNEIRKKVPLYNIFFNELSNSINTPILYNENKEDSKGLFKYNFEKVDKQDEQYQKALEELEKYTRDNKIGIASSNVRNVILKDWERYKKDCAYALYHKIYHSFQVYNNYKEDKSEPWKYHWIWDFNDNQRRELVTEIAKFADKHEKAAVDDKDINKINAIKAVMKNELEEEFPLYNIALDFERFIINRVEFEMGLKGKVDPRDYNNEYRISKDAPNFYEEFIKDPASFESDGNKLRDLMILSLQNEERYPLSQEQILAFEQRPRRIELQNRYYCFAYKFKGIIPNDVLLDFMKKPYSNARVPEAFSKALLDTNNLKKLADRLRNGDIKFLGEVENLELFFGDYDHFEKRNHYGRLIVLMQRAIFFNRKKMFLMNKDRAQVISKLKESGIFDVMLEKYEEEYKNNINRSFNKQETLSFIEDKQREIYAEAKESEEDYNKIMEKIDKYEKEVKANGYDEYARKNLIFDIAHILVNNINAAYYIGATVKAGIGADVEKPGLFIEKNGKLYKGEYFISALGCTAMQRKLLEKSDVIDAGNLSGYFGKGLGDEIFYEAYVNHHINKLNNRSLEELEKNEIYAGDIDKANEDAQGKDEKEAVNIIKTALQKIKDEKGEKALHNTLKYELLRLSGSGETVGICSIDGSINGRNNQYKLDYFAKGLIAFVKDNKDLRLINLAEIKEILESKNNLSYHPVKDLVPKDILDLFKGAKAPAAEHNSVFMRRLAGYEQQAAGRNTNNQNQKGTKEQERD